MRLVLIGSQVQFYPNVHEGLVIAPANESSLVGRVRSLARQDAVNPAPKFHRSLAMIQIHGLFRCWMNYPRELTIANGLWNLGAG